MIRKQIEITSLAAALLGLSAGFGSAQAQPASGADAATRQSQTAQSATELSAQQVIVRRRNNGGNDERNIVLLNPNAAPVMAVGGAVQVLGPQATVMGEVVKGKPYSAESITESIRVLTDGNRIVEVNRAQIYRDGDGRTRLEQTLNGVGPWGTGSEPVTLTTINDPVAGVSRAVGPDGAAAARRIVMFRSESGSGGAFTTIEDRVTAVPVPAIPAAPGAPAAPAAAAVPAAPAAPAAAAEPAVPAAPPGPAAPGVPASAAVPGVPTFGPFSLELAMAPVAVAAIGDPGAPASTEVTEDLGEQVLQGVLARGTRRVQTIPAGAINNERPIEVVTEEWYAPDLEAVISRHTRDPRFGETSYRLVNVVLGEPSPDLFVVQEQ